MGISEANAFLARASAEEVQGVNALVAPLLNAMPPSMALPNDPATALDHIAYTAPYNFSEQPAASVNAGFTPDGRPVGLQLAGRRFDDVRLLRVARWYETARGPAATPTWPA